MSIEGNRNASDSTHANHSRNPASEKLAQEAYSEPPKTKGSTFDTQPDGTKVKQYANGGTLQVKPDGTVTEQFATGETVSYSTDGSITRSSANGTTVIESPDGSRLTSTPEGGHIQELPSGIKAGIGPDGTRVLEFPDGSKSTLGPDGTKVNIFADSQQLGQMAGDIETILPDGTTIYDLVDGTRIESHPDGTEIVIDPDGQKITTGPGRSGRTVEYPDGKIRSYYTGQDELLDALFPGRSQKAPATTGTSPSPLLNETELARVLDNLPPESTHTTASAPRPSQAAQIKSVTSSSYHLESHSATIQAPSSKWDLTRMFKTPKGQIVNGALGTLGILGGGLQMAQGFRLMAQGNTGEGAFTTLGGGANTTAGAASFFARIPWAQNLAMRAGGAGAVIDGALTLHRGFQSGDAALQADGGVRLTAGGAMLAGGPAGALGASAYVGWAAGRFLGETVSWQGKTLDQHTTQMWDSTINGQANQQLQEIETRNQTMLDKQKSILDPNCTYEDIKAQGKTARDVSEAILGLREEIEKANKQGHTEDSGKMQEQITRLITIRAQLAGEQSTG
ncbi:MAG: hypothetical protein HY711_06635 [Candidatus Melainabacteria bacterium]|nr:hypothetical protein [Candidatus Melainabacteria bacterium]